MAIATPDLFALASGDAEGFMPLNAFDGALLRAGVGNTNLVRMSSIIPPRCRRLAAIELPPGALVPVAYASESSERPGELIAAAVAAALPEDPRLPGLIMEHHGSGPAREIEATVRRMAEEGFRTRGWRIRELVSIAAEHRVVHAGCAFACVVLWYSQESRT